MKILAINSSPRKLELSTTKSMLSLFAAGMMQAGAEVETVYLYEEDIKTCKDCTCCMTTSIGKCVIEDDMTKELYPKFLETDILVLATPVYFGTLNAKMKVFIERLFPYLDSHQYIEGQGILTQHFKAKWPKIVLLASASWHYGVAFEQISSYFHYLFGDELIAEIYRGNSNAFMFCDMFEEKQKEVTDALIQAGKELVQVKAVSAETIHKISQDLGDIEKIVISHNLSIDSSIKANMNALQWTMQGRKISPNSIDNFMDMMKIMFHKEKCQSRFSMQFCFSGKEKGDCYCIVDKENLELGRLKLDKADVTIKTPFELWVDILEGNKALDKLMMEGRTLVKGNLSLMSLFSELFYYSN